MRQMSKQHLGEGTEAALFLEPPMVALYQWRGDGGRGCST
mgnify:CR=1 FL=1|jgi:hypothetical protein